MSLYPITTIMIYYHVYYDLFRAGQHRGSSDKLEVPKYTKEKHKISTISFKRANIIQLQVVIESHDI